MSQSRPTSSSTHPSPRWVKTDLQMAFKQGTGVLEVLFGVGFGGGDAVKRFVEDADDPLLFGERGNGNVDCFEVTH